MSEDRIILSVSRRTDVPAFYSEWFMNRLEEGRLEYRHPYTGKVHEVIISPEGTAAIVFWTKNFAPMLERLDEMEALGYGRYLVHYTITGLGRGLEPLAPPAEESIRTLEKLSGRVGPERLIWRFDPIVLSKRTGVASTLERFAGLAAKISGKVRDCFTSVMEPYAKTRGRLAAYEAKSGDEIVAAEGDDLMRLSMGLGEAGRKAGISVRACCSPGLLGFGVQPARCIDGDRILSLWPGCGLIPAASPTRKSCGCDRAVDVGAYDSCPHRCVYCYANAADNTIARVHANHDPRSAGLA